MMGEQKDFVRFHGSWWGEKMEVEEKEEEEERMSMGGGKGVFFS